MHDNPGQQLSVRPRGNSQDAPGCPQPGGGVTAVPLSDTVCGLPDALSVMESVPVRLPGLEGVKVKVTVQFAPTMTLEPQVLVSSKLAVVVILSMFRVAEPMLLRPTDSARLVRPTDSSGKFKLVTDRVAVGDPPQALSRQTAQTASRKCLFILPPGETGPSRTTVRGKVGGYD